MTKEDFGKLLEDYEDNLKHLSDTVSNIGRHVDSIAKITEELRTDVDKLIENQRGVVK
jgi:hypothetical protein